MRVCNRDFQSLELRKRPKVSLEPVSYTHLDVYKRQNYIIEQAVLEGRQNGFNYADGKFLDWVDSKIGKGIGNFIRKVVNFIRATMLKRGFPININKPVSYTHLDVYKRQTRN